MPFRRLMAFALMLSCAHAHAAVRDCHRLLAVASFRGSAELNFERARELAGVVLDDAVWNLALSPGERDLVIEIHRNLESEGKELVFVPFSQHPETFGGLDAHRVAATGDNVGDPVYVNTEAIAGYTLEQALGILIHEYGHHAGIKDDEARTLDAIAEKIVRAAKFERHALDESLGFLPTASMVSFEVTSRPAHFHVDPRNRRDIGAWSRLSREDSGYGTHLIVSDGYHEFDVRELIASSYAASGKLHYLSLTPKSWSVDEESRGSYGDPELVIGVEASFNDEAKLQNYLEIRIPLAYNVYGKYLFKTWMPAYVPEIPKFAPYRNQVLSSLSTPLRHVDGELQGYDVVLEDRGNRVEVSMTFDAKMKYITYPWPFWGRVLEIDGEQMTGLLPESHPLMHSGRIIARTELEGGSTRITMAFDAPETTGRDVKFIGAVLPAAFSHPKYPVLESFLITPDLTPTLSARGAEGGVRKLKHVGASAENQILHSLRSTDARPLDLTVEVPEDFPIRSDADLEQFRARNGGRVHLLLEDPNANYNHSSTMPTKIKNHSRVYFRPARAVPAVHPELPLAPRGDTRTIRLPLQLELTEYLYPDVQHTIKYNTWTAPERLKIRGLVLESADLRTWHLPVDVEITFDHAGVPRVPTTWTLFSAKEEDLKKNPIAPELPALSPAKPKLEIYGAPSFTPEKIYMIPVEL